MRIALPICGNRIAPVFDVARRFLMVDAQPEGRAKEWETPFEDLDPIAKTKRLTELGAQVLICGAISRPLQALLAAAGVRVIPNTCGELDEVVEAFLAGELCGEAFRMPGCALRRIGPEDRRESPEPDA